MPANILRINALQMPFPIATIHLATHKNSGTKVFTDTLDIIHMLYPPIPNLAIDSVLPSCDWATITMTVIGATKAGGGPGILHPAGAGLPIPGWGPFPSLLPQVYAPFTPSSGNVTVVPFPRMVISPPPQIIMPGPPGVIASMSYPGSEYKILFAVKPNPGVRGIKRWEFKIQPINAQVVVTGAFLDPGHPDSD